MPKEYLLNKNIGKEGLDFVNQFCSLEKAIVLATQNIFNIESIESKQVAIINIERINDIKKLNSFLKKVNKKLNNDGVYVGCAETYMVRKNRLMKKFPKPLNHIYYFFDFLITRVLPKIWFTSRVYFYLSGGKGRVLSKTEVLGRLVYCGFGIAEVKQINNLLYFAVKKVNEPQYDAHKPKYGFFIKLPRIGKDSKIIKVYKLRTMHAYSEYIQKYVFEQNNLAEGGKLKNDFRIPTYGEKLRKYWIDELPMLINLLKGEMKIIGVRPLSAHYLSLYNPELVALRTQTKPGLLPPFYADSPKTLDEIMDSEKKYLLQYLKSPFKTDVKYFFKILHTIFIKGKRSS
ncbi:sugar transferase [Flavobacterium branchiophilum]|uniref:Probable sugar transferase involved in polysaccharide synthesis n=1 Tax=Flavobacterium branchiophilum (strain FL-15) TaxID=1034807 RepID=G2Z7L9_FLABF|nr:sugar transferase [Flavobacterium branchiophilum]CCB69138.1 Probable sugar transferase involved in polysaccharide synthesis [Flavobacterium branchiophilum FL-15]